MATNTDIEKQTSLPRSQSLHSTQQSSGDDTGRDENAIRCEGVDVTEQPSVPSPDVDKQNEKTMLQDQTNLLPFRQLILVFVGLGCAVFCEFLWELEYVVS